MRYGISQSSSSYREIIEAFRSNIERSGMTRLTVLVLLALTYLSGCAIDRSVHVTQNPVEGWTKVTQQTGVGWYRICTGPHHVVFQGTLNVSDKSFRHTPRLTFLIDGTERFSMDGVAIDFDAHASEYGVSTYGTYNFNVPMSRFRRLCIAHKHEETIGVSISPPNSHDEFIGDPESSIHEFANELVSRGWMEPY